MTLLHRIPPVAHSLALVLAVGCGSPAERAAEPPNSPGRLMTPADLQSLPTRPPRLRAAYGPDSSQYGELRLPAGTGPHPVAVLIHGGCFKAAYANVSDLSAMGDALEARGIATWNIEYRRLGEPGGGWPNTYLDVGRGVDHLRVLAQEQPLDLTRVVVVGHSAGGHLAMWTGARARLRNDSPLHVADPLPLRGVVNLAGMVDLAADIPGYEASCRDAVITSLLGGTPATVPEHYADVSALTVLPLGIPHVMVLGEHEDFVQRRFADAWVEAATRAGDSARLIVIPAVGHFEIAMPNTAAWPPIADAIQSLMR